MLFLCAFFLLNLSNVIAAGLLYFKSTIYYYNTKQKIVDTISLSSLPDNSFIEWFRGLTDGEGCFIIGKKENSFYFRFDIYMHKDDSLMLKYISERLNLGTVYVRDHFACLSVSNTNDLIKIFSIFDNSPLNTTKNLNYLLFKDAFELYSNRKSLNFEDVKR